MKSKKTKNNVFKQREIPEMNINSNVSYPRNRKIKRVRTEKNGCHAKKLNKNSFVCFFSSFCPSSQLQYFFVFIVCCIVLEIRNAQLSLVQIPFVKSCSFGMHVKISYHAQCLHYSMRLTLLFHFQTTGFSDFMFFAIFFCSSQYLREIQFTNPLSKMNAYNIYVLYCLICQMEI